MSKNINTDDDVIIEICRLLDTAYRLAIENSYNWKEVFKFWETEGGVY